ncbi:hypothetical protein AAFF_G00308300 [Aldrovandia affinis]|uniref:Ig-like domain-containing protein n=1 Tax=Aldrovandia affinis TaxID=143900 RepID=A0AAD7WQW4_9TELE|nr:hypothetical protein AAFF_G00308300 [Aldrovandia affinis]
MKRAMLPVLSYFMILLQSQGCLSVTVSSRKPRVEIHENEDAVLSCVFKTEKDNNPRIEWKKKGKGISYVYFDGRFRGSFAGRAKIEGATVTLYKAVQRDSGEYRCEVSAPLDSVTLGETNVSLKVLVPPHTPVCEIPSSALTGAVVEMRCRDKQSFPPATYKWYKDNKPLSAAYLPNVTYSLDPRSGTLHFRTVSRKDTGQYHCEASNGVGAPKSCEGRHLKIGQCVEPKGKHPCPPAQVRQPSAKSSGLQTHPVLYAVRHPHFNVFMATLDWAWPPNHQQMHQAEFNGQWPSMAKAAGTSGATILHYCPLPPSSGRDVESPLRLGLLPPCRLD